MEKATFAAGCFWGVELEFAAIDGVTATQVGYIGGTRDNPTYEQVCSGATGHAEAVELEFDPDRISYEKLVDHFWQLHDSTQVNRQGPDRGTQYRSAIFFHSPDQQADATTSRDRAQQHCKKPIATEIVTAPTFWPAEDYHQKYLEKRGAAACKVV